MATYTEEMFKAQIVEKEGMVRRSKWNIDQHEGMFESSLRTVAESNTLSKTETITSRFVIQGP